LGRRRLTVLVAGFVPGARMPNAMMNPSVRRRLRSPKPDAEWHSGELETAMMLSRHPQLVRGRIAKRLSPVWVDVHGALARGARNFRTLARGGPGYFGAPAVARAATGRTVMALRVRRMAMEIHRALRAR
jgi:hypothetical protein